MYVCVYVGKSGQKASMCMARMSDRTWPAQGLETKKPKISMAKNVESEEKQEMGP